MPGLVCPLATHEAAALIAGTTLRQDKVDDVAAGVKSTALLFGDRTKLVLSGFAGASVGLLGITGAPHALLCPITQPQLMYVSQLPVPSGFNPCPSRHQQAPPQRRPTSVHFLNS